MELLPCDPVIPLLEIYPKNAKTPIRENICTPMFIAASFTIAKVWKQLGYSSVDEWIKMMWYIDTMEYYMAIKKEGTLNLRNIMDGPEDYYAK